MTRVKVDDGVSVGVSVGTGVVPAEDRKSDGRPINDGTVLARVMKQRHIKAQRVATILHASDRAVHNYLKRLYPVPLLFLGALCDYLDMDPEELVDSRNYLLIDSTGDIVDD